MVTNCLHRAPRPTTLLAVPSAMAGLHSCVSRKLLYNLVSNVESLLTASRRWAKYVDGSIVGHIFKRLECFRLQLQLEFELQLQFQFQLWQSIFECRSAVVTSIIICCFLCCVIIGRTNARHCRAFSRDPREHHCRHGARLESTYNNCHHHDRSAT